MLEENTCEGVIIRSKVDIDPKLHRRIVLKHKNAKWQEVDPKKQKKWQHQMRKAKKRKLSEEAEEILGEWISRITANRWTNVLSKIGRPEDKKAKKRAQKSFRRDIIQEWERERPLVLSALSAKDRHQIDQHFQRELAAFFEEHE